MLTGVRRGSVTVDAGARLILTDTGTVSGDLINDGGSVEVAGSVDGRLIHRGGTTELTPDAVVVGGGVGIELTVDGAEAGPTPES